MDIEEVLVLIKAASERVIALKAQKAPKPTIEAAVTQLLALKDQLPEDHPQKPKPKKKKGGGRGNAAAAKAQSSKPQDAPKPFKRPLDSDSAAPLDKETAALLQLVGDTLVGQGKRGRVTSVQHGGRTLAIKTRRSAERWAESAVVLWCVG